MCWDGSKRAEVQAKEQRGFHSSIAVEAQPARMIAASSTASHATSPWPSWGSRVRLTSMGLQNAGWVRKLRLPSSADLDWVRKHAQSLVGFAHVRLLKAFECNRSLPTTSVLPLVRKYQLKKKEINKPPIRLGLPGASPALCGTGLGALQSAATGAFALSRYLTYVLGL